MNTEDDARAWVQRALDVPRETMERLDLFANLVREESERQNLISRATSDTIWIRHIADSAQLLRFAPDPSASWVDLGSGAGFPGMVVALLHQGAVTLVEERRLRADFLRRTAESLALRIEVLEAKAERIPPRSFGVISARAFAPLDKLLQLGTGFSTTNTIWLLPKGRNAAAELEALDPSWQGRFRLEPSVTDAEAQIIVAEGVHRKARGKSR